MGTGRTRRPRQAVAGPISIRQGCRNRQTKPSTFQAIDIEAIRAEAQAGYAAAGKSWNLRAGRDPGRPRDCSPRAQPTRQFLIEARAAEEATEIRSHVMPDTGTTAKTKPEDGPVMKAVERLTAKGVN
jgi:hypothetical protein